MANIKRIGPMQTAKIISIIYFAISLVIFMPFMLIMSAFGKGHGPGIVSIILMPVMTGVVSFVFTAIGCVIYNFFAKRFGGIEIDIE